jgi:hypothetical protein
MAATIVTDPAWFDDAQAAGVLVGRDGYADDGDAYTLAGVSRPVPTSSPTITALTPATFAHTDPPTTVTITGTGFVHGDRVVFGGATPATNYHDDTELEVRVNPADWQPGDLSVLIAWSTRGPSAPVTFTVT